MFDPSMYYLSMPIDFILGLIPFDATVLCQSDLISDMKQVHTITGFPLALILWGTHLTVFDHHTYLLQLPPVLY